MVTTTLDISVLFDADGDIRILYRVDDIENAFEGYFSDYYNRALDFVKLPVSVFGVASAYALIYLGETKEIYCQPRKRHEDDAIVEDSLWK